MCGDFLGVFIIVLNRDEDFLFYLANFYSRIREVVTDIADELSSKYDTLLIQTLDGKSYNIITNRPIYEDGKFDG